MGPALFNITQKHGCHVPFYQYEHCIIYKYDIPVLCVQQE